MTLEEFTNGVRVLWNIDMRQYLSCINDEDREYVGDEKLWNDFSANAHKTFANLPDQDQRRVFAIIVERNAKAEERRIERTAARNISLQASA
jgi:hypothetical protein